MTKKTALGPGAKCCGQNCDVCAPEPAEQLEELHDLDEVLDELFRDVDDDEEEDDE